MTDATLPAGPWGAKPPSVAPPPAPTPDGLTVDFTGRRGALFWLALKTGFFTILTLGFYRFWMKTRLRRWYWSAIRPGGHPMEYVGDPFEKLLGFFIAVVILTFYIGILNLLLMFVSFSVFNSSVVGYVASFAGVIPLLFYARYRARRYVLGRTRWRGVRFGLEPGAWGYAWRALWYWFLTIVTLGVLWPRMTFLLEKYKTDRTFFGSARLTQGGRWPMLYRAAIPFVVSLAAFLAALAWLLWLVPVAPGLMTFEAQREAFFDLFVDENATFTDLVDPERLLLIPLTLSAILFGAIYYRWVAKRIMAQHKSAPGVQFASRLSGLRVTMIYVMGNFIAYISLVMGIIVLGIAAVFLFAGDLDFLIDGPGGSLLSDLPRWLSLALLAVLYLGFFLMWGVLYNTFVTFPLMRHMALTTTLPVTVGLPLVSQRKRDEFAEAEGFAEALDLGAAI